MSRKSLYVHYEKQRVGVLDEDENGLLLFSYDQQWLHNKNAFPLSLALNLQVNPYKGKVVTSFFENLIPEGEQRRQIERIAALPEADNVAFLERFGEECAGAITISPNADHQSEILKNNELEISFEDIEKAIDLGLPMQSILDSDGELPPFSLAGAQAKFPCRIHNNKITFPSGEPTTHIIKLPIRSGDKLLDSVENEYLCMRLAGKCGLTVPSVMILGEKIPLFAIERFDRRTDDQGVHRIHTQDICQALGRPSKEKYEKHGGPSFAECYSLIRDHSSTAAVDLLALLDWFGFNLAIGNNDSHAKNISLMLVNQRVVLAPWYDLISTALYPQYNAQFAFKIAEVSSWDKITIDRINEFAKKFDLRGNFVMDRWKKIVEKLKFSIHELNAEFSGQEKLAKTMRKISKECEKRIGYLEKALRK